MSRRQKILWNFYALLAVFVLSSVLVSCAYNEATGSSQFNVITEAQELKIGAEAHQKTLRDYGLYPDEALAAYVDEIGQRVVAFSGRSDIPYYFFVLDSEIINAFALPGGYVYVTRGLLAQLNTESELAFVLAHEVAHIAGRHGAQKLSQYAGIGVLGELASVFFEDGARKWGRLASEGFNLAILGHGREMELEADRLGVKYAYAASYDPRYFDDFFHSLKGMSSGQNDALQALYSSHPDTGVRIDQLERELSQLQITDYKGLDVGREQYLSKIDGLFIGKSPYFGSISGSEYVNLQLGLRFSMGTVWEARRGEGNTVMAFRHKRYPLIGRLEIRHFAKARTVKEFSQIYERRLPDFAKEISKQKIGYLSEPAYQSRFARLKTELSPDSMEISTYFTQGLRGIRLYTAMDSRVYLRQSQSEVDALVRSVEFLSPMAIRKLGGYRLALHTVKKGEELQGIARQYFPKDVGKGERAFRRFNGLTKTVVLTPGQRLKVPVH